MDSRGSAAAVPPSSTAARPSDSTKKQKRASDGTAAAAAVAAAAPAAAAESVATGPAVQTELKSETWPYPLKLPTLPLDFNLLRNPKLSIFHDACGRPLVRYYWPASTAAAEAPNTQKDGSTHSPTRTRGVVVLVHDEGTHTVFDWLKNAPVICRSREATTGDVQESAHILSLKATSTAAEPRAAPPPLDIGLMCAEFTVGVQTAPEEAAAAEIPSASASAGETVCTRKTAAAKEAEGELNSEKGDAPAAAAAAAVTAAAAATAEGIASLLPASPLFRDLPQMPLHAARRACYEGSWVELFNAAGFDVHAVDLLQHGLSGLVERQQQRQRKRRWKHERKSREEAASGTDSANKVDDEDAPFSFDLLAEDLCCLLEEICRFSTLPIFLFGQGIGATAAARAAELLAKRGKLGKPHMRRSASDATAKSADAPPADEESLPVDPAVGGYEGVATSPLLAGVRHIGKETILPVQHVAVQARPIPLAGLVLLSPVLQLRESVALEQMVSSTAAAARREKAKQRKQVEQHLKQKTEGPHAEGRRSSGESYVSEPENSTSAEDEEVEKGSGTWSREQKGSSWNILSWLLGRPVEKSSPAPVQYGVRLRRRRHPHPYQHMLLPPLDIEEAGELPDDKEFDALYEKLYFRDRLTIKTLLPFRQLVELRKGVCRTLNDARWLLIPIERDSQQLVTVATWQEQYQKWKQTIARRVREGMPGGPALGDQLLQQQGVVPFFIEEDPLAGLEPSVDLAPWLQQATPQAAAAGAAAVAAAGAAATRQGGPPAAGEATPPPQQDEDDDVQQEADATDAEIRRRKQLKRMQMAFYLKVLVVQGMSAPQDTEYVCCGCRSSTKVLAADREVECFADATDVQGVVSFYRSLGGKGSVARRILVAHKQLPPPVFKRSTRKGTWLADCCRSGDDDAAAALAAAAAQEAAQTGSLVLLDVGSEEARMGDESEWGEEDEPVGTVRDKRYAGTRQVHREEAGAGTLERIYGTEMDSRHAAFVPRGVATETAPGLPSPFTILPASATGAASPLPTAAPEEGGNAVAAADTRRDSDVSSHAAIEARYAALQEERKRLDENLRLLDADVEASTGADRAAAQEEGAHPMLRRPSSVYKSVYERDLIRYGTVVRLPDRRVPLGEPTITTEDLCRNVLLRYCGDIYGRKSEGVLHEGTSEASLEAWKHEAEKPRLEILRWVKEYPVSWWNCSGGMLLPYACLQAPCEANTRVRIVEEVYAPVRVVEKIIMHEATDALKATIAEIEAREQRQKGGGEPGITPEKGESQDREYLAKFPAAAVAAPTEESDISKTLLFRDLESWRRVGGIVVDGKGRQVPLEHVEKLRVHHPREYVNLFLYGATSEAAAAVSGGAEMEGMSRRQITLWLLPEVHHPALCQADTGNKLGKHILNKWLLPALQDLQRSESVWQGSQMRSQLRKQLSSQSVLHSSSN